MTLDQFTSEAWRDHGTQPELVARKLPDAITLLTTDEDVAKLVSLAAHVWGEHLGLWDDGIRFLERLGEYSPEAKTKVSHAIAGFELAAGKRNSVEEFPASLQIRALCVAAPALIEHGDSALAARYFLLATELASELQKDDPTNRVLAVTANNMASSLEQAEQRTPEEMSLMVECAQTARRFWEIAGGWLEVERAEYRLVMSFLKANDAERALVHARLCFDICESNQAAPVELFFAYEAIALSERAKGNRTGFENARKNVEKCFSELDSDDKSWCEATISSLRSAS